MELSISKFLKDLEFLINTDSHSDDTEGNLKILKFFEGRLSAAGLTTCLTFCGQTCRPALAAEHQVCSSFADGAGPVPRVLLSGHVDTVFPGGTADRRPFTVVGDKAFGPGIVDMKAGALLMIYLAEYMSQSMPHIPFKLFLNSDEEIGSPDTIDFMRETAKDCDIAFIFEGGRKKGQFVTRRKGIAKYHISIAGKASHSGTAHADGVSAIVELANWIIDLNKLNNYKKGLTLNIGTISGGSALNIVAPYAEAMLEVRYTAPKDYQYIDSFLKKRVLSPYLNGASAEVSQISHYPPLNLNDKTLALLETLRPLHLSFVSAGGISDANRLACLDIAILDGCGPSGGFPHSENEFLSIPTVTQRFETIIRIIEMLHR